MIFANKVFMPNNGLLKRVSFEQVIILYFYFFNIQSFCLRQT